MASSSSTSALTRERDRIRSMLLRTAPSHSSAPSSSSSTTTTSGGSDEREVTDSKWTESEWNARLDNISVDRDQLDQLVMDYLFTQGYQEAAEVFAEEAHCTCSYLWRVILV
jgi:LisH